MSHMMNCVWATVLVLISCGPANAQTSRTHDAGSTQPQTETEMINPDRPGSADGSTVVRPQTFQIESGLQLEYRRSGDTHEHTLFVPTLLRFGVAKRWEARVEGNTFTRASSFQ